MQLAGYGSQRARKQNDHLAGSAVSETTALVLLSRAMSGTTLSLSNMNQPSVSESETYCRLNHKN
jgi:hypothetical protein